MAQVVWKHELPQEPGFMSIILPTDTKFLHIGMQHGKLCVWTLQDNFRVKKEYHLLHWITGKMLENHWNHIGTIIDDTGDVSHFFWR